MKEMTLTEQWKKGELKDGYYYAEDGGEELIIHIQGKNGSVMGDDFNLEATDWIKPIAPVPSYEEWKSTGKFAMEAMKVAEENQQLKELLSKIRNRQSLIRECLSGCKLGSAWDLLYQTENEIDNAIGEKK